MELRREPTQRTVDGNSQLQQGVDASCACLILATAINFPMY